MVGFDLIVYDGFEVVCFVLSLIGCGGYLLFWIFRKVVVVISFV